MDFVQSRNDTNIEKTFIVESTLHGKMIVRSFVVYTKDDAFTAYRKEASILEKFVSCYEDVHRTGFTAWSRV